MSITPDWQPHGQLEDRVADYLTARGFLIEQMTYHERLPGKIVRLLQSRYDPTALYLRGRADRIAIHETLPVQFEWEAKTHVSQRYHDMTIEALPLAHHMSKSKLGVRCMYVYHNPFRHDDRAFWADNVPPVRQVFIPNRWAFEVREWFHELLMQWFPAAQFVMGGYVGGSGDPFVIVDKSELAKLPHWETLIDKLIGR